MRGGGAAVLAALVLALGAVPAAADVVDDNPGAASRGPGDEYVLARGADGATYERHLENDAWTPWSSIGGSSTSGPAAAAYGSAITVFVRGSDNAVWENSVQGGRWTGWGSLGGIATSAPAGSARRGTPYFDVAVRGVNDAVYFRSYVPGHGWLPWSSLGGVATSAPAVNSQTNGVVNVFVRGTDNAIYQDYWDGSKWSNWFSLGGYATSAPIAVTHQPGTVDLFVRGIDNAVYQRHWSGSAWTDWFRIDPTAVDSGPGGTSQGPGHVQLFARRGAGVSGKLWTSSGGWRAWTDLGVPAPPAPPPPAVAPGPAPDGRVTLHAGLRCTPVGGLLAVDVKVRRKGGAKAPHVRRVRFYIRRGPHRVDHHRPFRVRLRVHRPAGSKGRVYARVWYVRAGSHKLRHKTVSRRFVMCG